MIDYTQATDAQLKEEFKRLAKVSGDVPFGTKKEFFHLPKILNTGEAPLAVASGLMDGNTWLITLTNQRVIFLDKGMIYGVKQVDINLKDIVSVGGKTGLLLGDIMISTAGQNYTVTNVQKGSVIPFTNLVNETRNKKNEPKSTNIQESDDFISRLERLAALKEKGILSEEEFQQQKQRILNG
ncbi:PH domain-containing protein [Leclercia adecarboxylata]|uniref:PH domain-containing protein n=1 Tax=Leclercia adecarboxylata TaxID=83655 RepID=UPI0027C35294|nr:PH domain-containing protein [Leclercia adecarboxylata]MDQ2129551.1 PH domain-containing protein [Leclercia adecarboxylata]MDV7059411.1 PH domain-containing protein [Leclercia adecarboxylata]